MKNFHGFSEHDEGWEQADTHKDGKAARLAEREARAHKEALRQLALDTPVVVTCFTTGPITGRWKGFTDPRGFGFGKATVLLDNPPDGHPLTCYTSPEWIEEVKV